MNHTFEKLQKLPVQIPKKVKLNSHENELMCEHRVWNVQPSDDKINKYLINAAAKAASALLSIWYLNLDNRHLFPQGEINIAIDSRRSLYYKFIDYAIGKLFIQQKQLWEMQEVNRGELERSGHWKKEEEKRSEWERHSIN